MVLPCPSNLAFSVFFTLTLEHIQLLCFSKKASASFLEESRGIVTVSCAWCWGGEQVGTSGQHNLAWCLRQRKDQAWPVAGVWLQGKREDAGGGQTWPEFGFSLVLYCDLKFTKPQFPHP